MADALRPRFRYLVPYSPEKLVEKVKTQMTENNPNGFYGSVLKYHMVLDYPEKVRHFWSPQIDINIEVYKEQTLIRGLVGPRPNVWTIFMFFNSVAGFAGIVGLIIGTGQWSMETAPHAYWLLPISAIMFFVIYSLGKTGKKIAHDESVELHSFFVESLEDYTEVELDDL